MGILHATSLADSLRPQRSDVLDLYPKSSKDPGRLDKDIIGPGNAAVTDLISKNLPQTFVRNALQLFTSAFVFFTEAPGMHRQILPWHVGDCDPRIAIGRLRVVRDGGLPERAVLGWGVQVTF